MTWCQYRKLALEEAQGTRREAQGPDPSGASRLAPSIGSSGGIDLGTLLLAGTGLAVVVHLASSKKSFGYGR